MLWWFSQLEDVTSTPCFSLHLRKSIRTKTYSCTAIYPAICNCILSSPWASSSHLKFLLLHSHFQPDLKEIVQQRWIALFLATAFLSELKKLKWLQEKYKCISSVPHSFWEAMPKKRQMEPSENMTRQCLVTGRHENWKRLEERNIAVGEKGRE